MEERPGAENCIGPDISDFFRGEYPFNYEEQLVGDHSEKLKQIFQREIIPPLHFEILPTEICNLECVWCRGGHRDYMKSTQELSQNRLEELMQELKDYGIEGIVRFSGMSGEPLVNKGTLPAIKKGIDLGLKVGLITNGILLDESTHKYLDGMEYVSISLDAGTEKKYNMLKGAKTAGTFDKVLDNLEALVKFRNSRTKKFRITTSYMLHPNNVFDLKQAAQIVKNVGADAFQVKIPFCGPSFTPHLREIALLDLRYIERKSDKKFRVMQMQSDEELELGFKGITKPIYFPRCYAQLLNGVVSADGNVYPCVHHDYNGDVISGYSIGSIKEKKFREIWEDPARKMVIEGITPRKHCEMCNRYDFRMNNFLNAISQTF